MIWFSTSWESSSLSTVSFVDFKLILLLIVIKVFEKPGQKGASQRGTKSFQKGTFCICSDLPWSIQHRSLLFILYLVLLKRQPCCLCILITLQPPEPGYLNRHTHTMQSLRWETTLLSSALQNCLYPFNRVLQLMCVRLPFPCLHYCLFSPCKMQVKGDFFFLSLTKFASYG